MPMTGRRVLLTVLIALLALSERTWGQSGTAGRPVPRPRLTIESIEHDLGAVKKSAGAEYTFRFRNEGASDLEILRVAPS